MAVRDKYNKLKDQVTNYFYKYNEYEEDKEQFKPRYNFTIHIKFFRVQKHENVDDIRAAIKEGNVMLIIDISLLHTKSFAHLKVITQKLRRTCESEDAQMKFYSKNWVIIIPDKLKFYKAKTLKDLHGTQH